MIGCTFFNICKMRYKAFLFDLNGTMIDDMQYHINAWYRILNHLGADITIEKTKAECYGKNDELLERIFPGRFSVQEKGDLSIAKEQAYQTAFRPHLQLLPGLETFLQHARQHDIKMAIGSAAIRMNIDFVLDGLSIRHYIDTIVSADDVAFSKPDPETFLQCASQLNIAPEQCLVFEDSPKGVASAAAAGMHAAVLLTLHEANEFAVFENVVAYAKDFTAWTAAQIGKG